MIKEKLEEIWEKIEKILYQCKGLEPLKVFIGDEIPKSKLNNALNSYGQSKKDDEIEPVIMLGDDTAFGSATDGFFITTEKFYFHELLKPSDCFDIADIEHIEKISESFNKGFKFRIKGRINDIKFLPTLPNKKEQDQLFNLFNDLFPLLVEANKLKEIYQNEILEKEREEARIIKIQAEEKEQKKILNSKFDSANDELLQRIDKIFENIKEIDKCITLAFFVEAGIKLQYFPSNDFFGEGTEFVDQVSLITYRESVGLYENLKNECNNLSIVATVLQKNQDIVLQKLAFANEFIEPYGMALERFRAFLSELYGVEIQPNITKDEVSKLAETKIIQSIYEKSFKFPVLNDEIDEDDEIDGDEDNEEKANSALTNFFVSNSDGIIEKLKSSGVLLTASALQNNQNIMRIANIVYNLLPTPIRIFVSIETVENFLFENRDWLIDKIS